MKLLIAFTLCLLICLLCSCGQSPEEQVISGDLVPYVEGFKAETGIEFHNTDIFLADIPLDQSDPDFPIINGKCYQGIGVNIVLINSNVFGETQKGIRTALLAHELGHCLFGIPHNETLQTDGCPVSVMHPHLLSSECWELHKSEYYQELIEKYKTFGAF
jgi:hypothetical protein